MSAIVCVLCVTVLVVGTRIVPGDPATALLGKQASPELIAQTREDLGLNDSAPRQLYDYFSSLLRGDLGTAYQNEVPVTDLILTALPHTMILGFTAMLMAVIIGIPLGVLVAMRPNGLLDRTMGGVSIGLITIPQFVFVLVFLLVFSVALGWFPAVGTGSLSDPIGYAARLILPATALAVVWIGWMPRIIRANMIEVVDADFIRAARTFGLKERVIFHKYALKNALIPTVAVLGLGLGTTMANTLFAEIAFGRQGLGTLAYEALRVQAWPIVRATALCFAVFIVFSNLLADLSYRLVDPRIRLEEEPVV
jgi:peptide/nickel transport system permease protein